MVQNIFKGIKAYASALGLISTLGLWKYFAVPVLISFITAYLTINFFMKWISGASLKIFVIYRIILGITILLYAYF